MEFPQPCYFSKWGRILWVGGLSFFFFLGLVISDSSFEVLRLSVFPSVSNFHEMTLLFKRMLGHVLF